MEIENNTIPIALYFLNFKTIFETKPADKKPPITSIDETIEYQLSTKPNGDIKYGTANPNPLTVPKKILNVKKIKIKFLLVKSFTIDSLNPMSLSLFAKPEGGVFGLLRTRNIPGIRAKLRQNYYLTRVIAKSRPSPLFSVEYSQFLKTQFAGHNTLITIETVQKALQVVITAVLFEGKNQFYAKLVYPLIINGRPIPKQAWPIIAKSK